MRVKRRKVRRYRRFDGGTNENGSQNGGYKMASMPASQYIMGLVGVGVLFFVIGYGWEKGKETA